MEEQQTMATERVLDSRIQLRNDTAANWKAANPVLLKGELGIEIDTRKLKIGDGISAYTGLKYVSEDLIVANNNPTTTDTDYDVGELWVNQSDKQVFILIATSESSAVWKRLVTADEIVVVAEAQVAQKLKTARAISLSGDVTGATTFDGSEDAAITVVLKNTGAEAGTFTKVTVNEKGLITKTELLTATDIPELTLAKITDAGTAAARDVGTQEGNLVEISANGKISETLLPAIAITDTYPVSSEEEMLALTAQKGDVAIRSDESRSYILKQEPATEKANWLELKSPECTVFSVNGKQGDVVLSTTDIGEGSNLYYTEARDTANFEENFAKKTAKDLSGGDEVLYESDTFVINGGNA
jgi:hypothetical protein